MVFTNFTRTESGNKIFFKNSTPIEGVKSLKYYKDNASGSFDKKEFRWSFDNNYWASWETLDQGNISSVNVGTKPYLFFEIRYSKANTEAKVTTFSVDYTPMSATDLMQCKINTGEIVPPTPIPPSYGGSTSCATSITEIINAQTLCGKPCDYYLMRSNHKGQQPISTITDLQKILNNLSGGIQNSITGGDNYPDTGIGVFYDKVGQDLLFKSIDVSGGGVTISEQDGVIYLAVDASFSYDDASVNELYSLYNSLSGDLYDLSIYVDTKFFSVDASIIRIDGSINDLYSKIGDSSLAGMTNIGGGDGEVYKEISLGIARLRTIDGSGIIQVYTEGDRIIITADVSGLTVDTSINNIINIGTGAEVLAQIDSSGIAELRTITGTGAITVSQFANEISIYVDPSGITVDPCTWTDTDPISADVGGYQGGNYIAPGTNSIEILEDMLYEYFPPNVTMQIDPSPGPTSLTGFYEKWEAAPISQGVSLTYSFNNNNFTKVRVFDVSIYENAAYYRTDNWGGLASILPYTTFDAAPDIGTASTDLTYSFQIGNKTGGQGMPNYDTSVGLRWVDPYFYGTVSDTVNASNITNADILGLNKIIVPEQTNNVVFDVSANFQKIKFVYAYPASYGDIRNIFDVKNDFIVTTSFDASIVNVKMSGLAGPGPYLPYKVYIKSHWISFTPDVSIFKLDFNI